MIPLIEKAIERGCVLVGVSAGAIMMCKEGYSDSYKLRGESDSFDFLEGLGFLNISFCPHYEDDSYRKHDLIEDLEKENRMVYALPNNTAMKIIDNSYEIIKSDPSKKVSIVTLKDKKLEEKTIEKGSLK